MMAIEREANSQQQSQSVLIAGSGYVGSALADALAARGRTVYALRRSDVPARPGVTPIRADVTDRASLATLPADIGVLVYAVAADSSSEAAYRSAYVDGLKCAVDAARERCPSLRRVLFASSTSVYGQADGSWIDETSETNPSRFSGRILLEAEGWLAESGQPATVLRFGGIYGPGRTRLVESVRAGRARCRPGPPHFTNRIHRDDASGALLHLLDSPQPESLYLGVDELPADECDVLCWMAERVGVAKPREATADESAASPRRAGSKRCRNTRLLASGYQFKYRDYREGYGSTIDAV